MGAYFFLDTKGSEKVREVETWFDVLSHVGGILDAVLFAFIYLAVTVNE